MIGCRSLSVHRETDPSHCAISASPSFGRPMQAALEKVISYPSLPSLPAVAIQILELTRDPNVSIKQIGKVVENDQAIAAKVLRTINSSYYGLASPCPSIQRALGYLGLNTVRSLVLGFSLVDSFRNSTEHAGFDLQSHWRRALFGATSARTIANRACCTDPDEAFIASMLQDVGMLAASMALGDEYNDAIAEAGGDHFAVERIEQERLGFTHSEAGSLLAKRWRLPVSMIESVRNHHRPESAPAEFRHLVQTVALSTIAAESLTVESPRLLINRFRMLGRDWFDLPVDGAAELLSTISNGASSSTRGRSPISARSWRRRRTSRSPRRSRWSASARASRPPPARWSTRA